MTEPIITHKRRWRLPALPVRRSVAVAIAFSAAIVIWVLSGVLGGNGRAVEAAKPISESNTQNETFKVVVQKIISEPYKTTLTLQARTEADKIVTIAAEMRGVIVEQDIEKGSKVTRGDVVCKIDIGARKANLDEARAMLQSREIEYSAAQKLKEKGYVSDSQVASARAAFDAAQANVKARQVELEHTEITAPFDGILDETPMEAGDFINVGQPCAKIVDKDPLNVVAFVSETQIGTLQVGANATAQLATGEQVEGKLTYIAESPSPETRTFRIEVKIPNKDLKLRDGITADLQINTGEVQASFIPQGAMSLNDDGVLGVRVAENNVVRFRPVKILSDNMGGAYVMGLRERELVIIVGGEFTHVGQNVDYEFAANETNEAL